MQPQIVDVLIGRLRQKIDAHHRVAHIQSVRGIGYMFRHNEDMFFDSLTNQPFLSWPSNSNDTP